MQPDSLTNRLLQFCAARRSIQHQPEAVASPEQRGAYRTAAPPRSDANSLLRTLHFLPVEQSINYKLAVPDVQDPADVNDAVSELAHLAVSQQTQHTIVVRATTARAISADIIRQTTLQHRCASALELEGWNLEMKGY